MNKTLTLDTEIINFADALPHWSKYLAEKILLSNTISENDIDVAFSCLLEDLNLKEKTDKTEIIISHSTLNLDEYKSNLFLSKIYNVQGVNALAENQTILFNRNLTIIYGENSSGKSGYTRLLKKVFYSKSPEDILNNVNMVNDHKSLDAKFVFISNDKEIELTYSDKDNVAFKQFAVFDGKCLIKQLTDKNEFEFRPAGLSFFAEFTNAIVHVEDKLKKEILIKEQGSDLSTLLSLFDCESEISSLIQNLSTTTTIEEIQNYKPFTDEDKIEKEKNQNQYDNLLMVSKTQDKEIQNLEKIKKLLSDNKQAIEKINKLFTIEYLNGIKKAITDCINKEDISKSIGIEKFETEKVTGIGSEEWKNFIKSAEIFAKKQKSKYSEYPEIGDNCLFCHQPLSEDAEKLISSYWSYISSIDEKNVQIAQESLYDEKTLYEELNFDLYPVENLLSVWLNENYQKDLDVFKQDLERLKILSQTIVSNIKNKKITELEEMQISTKQFAKIEYDIDFKIKMFKDNEQNKELGKLKELITFLEHKEKLNLHFSKIENYLNNKLWIETLKNEDFIKLKTNITKKEKTLSNLYFNQKYVESFNNECLELNGNFGIEINHIGSYGKSYRQLKFKGKCPNLVLSEGEQKVIAIADFLAEMNISELNRGIIFDDPVTSLDNIRKSAIAKRLIQESITKQVIVFSHDLVFVSNLLSYSDECNIKYSCHWIENRNGIPGLIWLDNSPSFERKYRNAELVREILNQCNNPNCSPMDREYLLKQGFTALRTCYEVLVINELFCNVVQRFNERVSIDSLSKVYFTEEIKNNLIEGFSHCCGFMEGHAHSDKYSYVKPEPKNLNEEIQRYDKIRKEIRDIKK